ncbi:MAG: transcriptional regulator, MarR family with acetyltransferase [Ramlibacter sp.]|nr:transcriptional regulator, MarR family with acetyltransferase [Ramlibacter sp.]
MNSPAPPVTATQVKSVRGFNRFYTQRIGVLAPYLGSDLSLTEVRVLYELAHRKHPAASELARDLSLDAGYLSRILRRFHTLGWLARSPSPADARQQLLELTEAGYQAFAPLQQKSRDDATNLLAGLAGPERNQLLGAMNTMHRLLDPGFAQQRTVSLREPRPGDMGWVVMQHGQVYGTEYGFNWEFEGEVAAIAAGFISNFRPARDKGWIAEIDGERVGSVFLVQKSPTVAQLRLLILTSEARGQGLGGRLVDECIACARARKYRKLVLGTQSHLAAARAIYQLRGFQLTHGEAFHGYGKDLVAESWELRL